MMDWETPEVEVIERCQGKAGEIQLQRRGSEYEIIYNGVFLMATYNGASEKAAIREALKIISARKKGSLSVLMGGLGAGFSLREALDFKVVKRVVVSEIEPAVIRWNRGPLGQFNNWAIFDPRVVMINNDFVELLKAEAKAAFRDRSRAYEVVMVDTDNGSSWLSLPANDYLYRTGGLKLINHCLVPGGVACFWCQERETVLEKDLAEIFSEVRYNTVPERTGKDGAFILAVK